MAEIVNYIGEKLLPEYAYMKKKKLFTDEQIRKIIKNREAMHYKTTKPNRKVEDFVEYIKSENNLLKTVKKMENKKLSTLQNSMISNIKNIYSLGLNYYPEKVKFWEEYVKFLRINNCQFEIHGVYEKMLQFHGDKPQVWIQAALFHLNVANELDRVKEIFLRGLLRHPDDIDLNIEFFKIILKETEKLSPEKVLENNTLSEQMIGIERLEIIYKNAIKKIDNIEFFIKSLTATEDYPFTTKIQRLIIKDVMEKFPLNAKLWHTLAQRELRGFSLSEIDKQVENNQQMMNQENENVEEKSIEKKTLKDRIQCCIAMYRTAVKELQTEEMWSYYINAMIELNTDEFTTNHKNFRRQQLGIAFKEAHEAKFMSEDFYNIYIELLKENIEGECKYLLEVMNTAIEKHPKSVKLWEHLLKFYIAKNDCTKIEETVKKSGKNLIESDLVSVYQLLIQYYETEPEFNKKLNGTYKELCNRTHESFHYLRGHYLEYTLENEKDFNITRKLYDELTLLPPPVLELHMTMIYLESNQKNPDLSRWRKCYENATTYFGKTSVEIWLNYLRFERDHGNPKNITNIYERAKQALNSELFADFLAQYQMLTITGY